MKAKNNRLAVNRIKEVVSREGTQISITDEGLNSIGITRHTWNKWLRRKKDPEVNQLEPIAQLLECSIDELIGRRENINAA